MHEPNYRIDFKLAQTVQSFVGPTPVILAGEFCYCAFPENRVTNTAKSEFGETIQVIQPIVMAGHACLVAIDIPYPIHGTLVAAPDLNHHAPAKCQASSLVPATRTFAFLLKFLRDGTSSAIRNFTVGRGRNKE
ncbi:hypothetical protein SPAN111604_11460 [Sphingomonas antarctica]